MSCVGLCINLLSFRVPAVCNEIDQWPPPAPGQTLNLPVMGVVIQVRVGDDPYPAADRGRWDMDSLFLWMLKLLSTLDCFLYS